MEKAEVVLKVEHLRKDFNIGSGIFSKEKQVVRAVNDISFELIRGNTLGIIGESGSGKTTLMRMIMGLETKTAGRIFIKQEEVQDKRPIEYKKNMQMIFQDSYASLDPRMTIQRILEEPFRVHYPREINEKRKEINPLLDRVGLPSNVLNKYPHELSGGQRQRISIARALATKPKLIVCDEPTSSLDVSTQAQILNLLKELQQEEKLSYLFVSHNMSVIRFISHDVIVMKNGKMVEHNTKTDLFNQPKEPYTKELIEAVPVADPNIKQFM